MRARTKQRAAAPTIERGWRAAYLEDARLDLAGVALVDQLARDPDDQGLVPVLAHLRELALEFLDASVRLLRDEGCLLHFTPVQWERQA